MQKNHMNEINFDVSEGTKLDGLKIRICVIIKCDTYYFKAFWFP